MTSRRCHCLCPYDRRQTYRQGCVFYYMIYYLLLLFDLKFDPEEDSYPWSIKPKQEIREVSTRESFPPLPSTVVVKKKEAQHEVNAKQATPGGVSVEKPNTESSATKTPARARQPEEVTWPQHCLGDELWVPCKLQMDCYRP